MQEGREVQGKSVIRISLLNIDYYCTPCLFIMLAVKTGSKRMTRAYSQISGYERPHVGVFVSDKKFPLWIAFSEIFGYDRKIRWVRVDASRIRKKKKKSCVFTNFRKTLSEYSN